MGAIFDMSQSEVCTWIHSLSPVLKRALGAEKCLPERNPRKLKEALEACELHDFIIDGTERERQRPSDPSEQKDFTVGNIRHTHIIISSLLMHRHKQSSTWVKLMKERTMTRRSAMKNSMHFLRTQHF